MHKLNAGLLAIAIALAGSSTALAQTAKQRLEMQNEIAWQKKLKAEQAASATTTQKCYMKAGSMVCGGGSALPKNTVAPVVRKSAVVPVEGKIGTAYGKQNGQGLTLEGGYRTERYYDPKKPQTNNGGAPYVGTKYFSQLPPGRAIPKCMPSGLTRG